MEQHRWTHYGQWKKATIEMLKTVENCDSKCYWTNIWRKFLEPNRIFDIEPFSSSEKDHLHSTLTIVKTKRHLTIKSFFISMVTTLAYAH